MLQKMGTIWSEGCSCETRFLETHGASHRNAKEDGEEVEVWEEVEEGGEGEEWKEGKKREGEGRRRRTNTWYLCIAC